jgi:hypothetical protein
VVNIDRKMQAKDEQGDDSPSVPSFTVSSRLNLIDLAGSERFHNYSANELGNTQSRETLAINQSLSCLANVINALTSNSIAVVPYRDSKLTRLLKSSLGGNAKTLFIACANSANWNGKVIKP